MNVLFLLHKLNKINRNCTFFARHFVSLFSRLFSSLLLSSPFAVCSQTVDSSVRCHIPSPLRICCDCDCDFPPPLSSSRPLPPPSPQPQPTPPHPTPLRSQRSTHSIVLHFATSSAERASTLIPRTRRIRSLPPAASIAPQLAPPLLHSSLSFARLRQPTFVLLSLALPRSPRTTAAATGRRRICRSIPPPSLLSSSLFTPRSPFNPTPLDDECCSSR